MSRPVATTKNSIIQAPHENRKIQQTQKQSQYLFTHSSKNCLVTSFHHPAHQAATKVYLNKYAPLHKISNTAHSNYSTNIASLSTSSAKASTMERNFYLALNSLCCPRILIIITISLLTKV
jgi:hypothetical protein